MRMMSKTLSWMAFLGVALMASHASAEQAKALKTQKEKISYAVGADVGNNFKRLGVDTDVDVEVLLRGLRDAITGKKLLMSDKELGTTLITYQAELKKKRAKTMESLAESNKKKGDAFLAENKKKKGVVTLPSGLQYKILKAGTGKKPTAKDSVEVNYRGTLINGTEFDSSARIGQPAVFALSKIIPGWREALQLMPVGSKWQIFIPSKLAYGDKGAGTEIGPNETIIFEVELLSIQ